VTHGSDIGMHLVCFWTL